MFEPEDNQQGENIPIPADNYSLMFVNISCENCYLNIIVSTHFLSGLN